jgi:prepilin-type N-terminal cleavage/methylation domain-containing protein
MLSRDHIVLNTKGFTLIEIIIVVVLLAIALVPLVSAYAPAIMATGGEEEITVFTNQARGTLNRVMTVDFDTLSSNVGTGVSLASLFGSTAEADKEIFSLMGKQYTPTVDITDASGGSGDLLQLTVTVDHVRLTTLKANY